MAPANMYRIGLSNVGILIKHYLIECLVLLEHIIRTTLFCGYLENR